MKVTYLLGPGAAHTSTAYLEDTPLSDGSYVGQNKHSETPVHVTNRDGEWVQVCDRIFEWDQRLGFIEVGPPPDCICTR